MIAKNTLLAAALRYARLGWFVVPVHSVRAGRCTCNNPTCSRPGKHPCTRHGVKDATNDPDVIRGWWTQWSTANVGIALGTLSGILTIDVDPRNQGITTLNAVEAKYGSLRDTTTAKTGGGGRHFIFAHPGFLVPKNALGPGIDILSDGQYIVAPPSAHSSGEIYSWIPDHDPNQQPPQQLPPAYQDSFRVATTQSATPGDTSRAGVVSFGQRNMTLVRLGGNLRRIGLSESAIRLVLIEENKTFLPALEPTEVERVVQSLLRYPSGAESGDDDPAFELTERVLTADFAGGDHLSYINGTFWRFNARQWYRTADEAVQQSILNAVRAGGVPKGYRPNSFSRDVLSLLKARTLREDDPLRFQAPPLPVINCRNGEVWLDDAGNATLRPHSPASGLRHCLEVDFDPSATCPNYDRALVEIFAKSSGPDAMVSFWNTITGYIIQPTRRHPLILVASGIGSNGKTSLADTLTRLLGSDLVYSGQVHKLSEGRFIFGDLLGKLLFIDDDVPAGVKLPDGELKLISEEKLLTGEQKYKPAFNFVCRVVPLLLCNNIPSLADLSHGMLRRLVVIPFDRRFDEREIDRKLFPAIWQKEMSGVLNRALEGYMRLVRQGRLLLPLPVRAARTSWLRHANPVTAFLNEDCEVNPTGSTLLANLYVAYCDWAKAAGITRVQQRLNFKRNLQYIGFEAKHTNRGEAVIGLLLRTGPNPVGHRGTPAVS